jgi:hypothetical protein
MTQQPAAPADILARPITTARAREAGVTTRELAGPLWTPVSRGLHCWHGLDVADPLIRILAVVELMPDDAVIGGWAALYLRGVKDLDGRTGPAAGELVPILVHIGPVGRVRPRKGIVLDRSTLLAEDVTVQDGIKITVPARSVVEIARRDGVEEAVVAGDAAGRFRVATPQEIQAYVDGHPGLRGIPRARVAAGLIDPRAASCPESRYRVVWVIEAGLPVPLVNHGLVDAAGFLLGKPDLFDKDAALAGEYDGVNHRDIDRHTSDNAREETFEDHNVTVVRATGIDLWPRRAQLVSRIRAGYYRGLARNRSLDAWGIRL